MSRSTANRRSRFTSCYRRVRLETLEPRLALTGTWTALPSPFTGTNVLTLLSDGSVMDTRALTGGGSYRLTPDASGNYLNETWSSAASMSAPRNYSSQHVLPDGRLLLLGGANGGVLLNAGEIYNPASDTWTSIAPFPETTFGNGPTMLLADGRLLAGSINGPQTYIYDPVTNVWSSGPTKLYGDSSNHESWTKLPDGSILSYDVNSNPGEAQRLDQSTMTWIDSGSVPVSLEAGIGAGMNMGPGVLLPDGTVLQLGRSSATAIYTPSATPGGTGTWTAGPVIPNGLEAGGSDYSSNDQFGSSTAVMLPNGHVLFCAEEPAIGGPTKFFEFDPTAPPATSLTDVTPLIAAYQTVSYAFSTRMVLLPTGQVLLGINAAIHGPYVYTPDGAPQAAWKPTITSVVANGNHYTLTGTQLNGLSAGAYYGGSTESASSYPIVELKDGSGHVYFAKTSNWSSTGVATGATPVTTDFTGPANMPYGTYSLYVVANGIASDPVSFTGGVVGPAADLAVTYVQPAASSEGDAVSYDISVTNRGFTNATNVVLKDTLGANLQYLSAGTPQGTVTHSGSLVTFSLGTVAVGQSVTVRVWVGSLEEGNLTSTASVTSSAFDADTTNNTRVITVLVTEPPIVVSAPIQLSGKKVTNVQAATFTHAGGVEPVSAFIATINWGDGSTSVGAISQHATGDTYVVKGTHTYANNNSYTVTTTVVEAGSSPNVAMALATTTSTSTQTNATASTTTGQAQPTASFVGPARLTPAVVDQVIDAAPLGRRNSALHASPEAASDDMLDEFFALN